MLKEKITHYVKNLTQDLTKYVGQGQTCMKEEGKTKKATNYNTSHTPIVCNICGMKERITNDC
jgi:hypothetical protein